MKKLIMLAAALLLTAAPASAAVQIVENGILIGATGVDVGGSTYDVSFLDGTCGAVFSGCDSLSDFAFNGPIGGALAADALLNQVFFGAFDTNPALTRGCLSSTQCSALIPTSFSILNPGFIEAQFAGNTNSTVDLIGTASFGLNFDSSDTTSLTFARFTLTSAAVPAVPEPSTWAMMLMGFGAVGLAMRLNRRRTKEHMTHMA